MKKEKLLDKIETAIQIEEEAIPIYTDNIEAVSSIFEGSDSENISKKLKILRRDSKRHKKILQDLEKKILEGEENEF